MERGEIACSKLLLNRKFKKVMCDLLFQTSGAVAANDLSKVVTHQSFTFLQKTSKNSVPVSLTNPIKMVIGIFLFFLQKYLKKCQIVELPYFVIKDALFCQSTLECSADFQIQWGKYLLVIFYLLTKRYLPHCSAILPTEFIKNGKLYVRKSITYYLGRCQSR